MIPCQAAAKAICKQLAPMKSAILGSAPKSNSITTASSSPLQHAYHNGVLPAHY